MIIFGGPAFVVILLWAGAWVVCRSRLSGSSWWRLGVGVGVAPGAAGWCWSRWGRDLSGGGGQGSAGGLEQPLPAPGPVGGQVHDDAVGAVGELGGDVDQVAAQGGGAGPPVGALVRVRHAEQVVRDGGAEQPGAVGGKVAGGSWS